MKYLYCPKCKELRVKPWYSITDRCTRCRGDVRVIDIPRTTRTYALYVTMGAALAFAYIHLQNREDLYLYAAVAFMIVTMVIQFKEVVDGERYARSKVKVTHSDSEVMKEKGWK